MLHRHPSSTKESGRRRSRAAGAPDVTGTLRRTLLAFFCVVSITSPARGQILPEERPGAPRYPGSLPFFYDLYTFRGEHGETLVVAAVAVAARWLERKEVHGEDVYRFDLSFVLADTTTRAVFRSDDTVSVAAAADLPDEHLLYTQVAVEAPPSASMVQRLVMTDPNEVGVGQLYDSAFPIPDYGGDTLMLSDIALGQADPTGGLARGGDTVAILPLARFPQSALDLYYEIYNMPPLEEYATEITFQPIDEAGQPDDAAVGVRFEARSSAAADRTVRELRAIAADLDDGLYRLTVAVRVARTGAAASRSRDFEVRRGGADATLVIALPRR